MFSEYYLGNLDFDSLLFSFEGIFGSIDLFFDHLRRPPSVPRLRQQNQ